MKKNKENKKELQKKNSPWENLLEYIFGHKYYIVVLDCAAMIGSEVSGIVFPDYDTALTFMRWILPEMDAYCAAHIHSFRSHRYYTTQHLYHKDFAKLIK